LVNPVQGKDTVWEGVNTSLVDSDGAITQGKYMQCKGIVQGNVVILEEGIYLPDGARVTVTVEQEKQQESAQVPHEDLAQRRVLGERMRAFSQRLAGRHVNLGDLVIEGREEFEDRA
jgi:hypothetical protein